MTIEIDLNRLWIYASLGISVAAFFIAIAPHFWRLFLPSQIDTMLPQSVKELIARYIYGTGCVLIGGGLAVALAGLWWIALIYLCVAIGCGFVVIFRYFSVDFASNKRQNRVQKLDNPNVRDG